jgi:hypothetical protein
MDTSSNNVDWNKWGAPAIILAVLGFVAAWIRPALLSLLHRLWRSDPARAVETALVVWKTDSGRLQMREYMKDILKEEFAISQKALTIAEENKDVLAQVKFTQEALGISVNKIQESVQEVPKLTDALDRISDSMQAYADHMRTVSDFMSRSDERERLRERYERGTLPDRRHHQAEPHPNNREEDFR